MSVIGKQLKISKMATLTTTTKCVFQGCKGHADIELLMQEKHLVGLCKDHKKRMPWADNLNIGEFNTIGPNNKKGPYKRVK